MQKTFCQTWLRGHFWFVSVRKSGATPSPTASSMASSTFLWMHQGIFIASWEWILTAMQLSQTLLIFTRYPTWRLGWWVRSVLFIWEVSSWWQATNHRCCVLSVIERCDDIRTFRTTPTRKTPKSSSYWYFSWQLSFLPSLGEYFSSKDHPSWIHLHALLWSLKEPQTKRKVK